MLKPIIITNVQPQVEAGLFPTKTEVDRPLLIEANIFKESHEKLKAIISYRPVNSKVYAQAPFISTKPWEDHYEGYLELPELGSYFFTIQAWVDTYGSWLSDYQKRVVANKVRPIDKQEGIQLIENAYVASGNNNELEQFLEQLQNSQQAEDMLEVFSDTNLVSSVEQYQKKEHLVTYEKEFEVWVEPIKSRFAAWYEMFPRSAKNSEEQHGTFLDCIERLSYIKDLGFDVIYFPPIHPIGYTHRKGKNNALAAMPGEPGCSWAIGAAEGGHKAVHPQLGTLDDFDKLLKAAKELDLEIALDFAIQCSPDHPYAREHPEWFFIRADGSIRYAENPPKEYQDIYPLNFWCEKQKELWDELKSILVFWIERGVKTFRVDNPHTKPLAFWEWCIREIKKEYPEVILLSEAFTKRNQRYALAKAGFTQSYTYFTWRNQANELQEYITEITSKEIATYFRGNLFANTPDILHEYLQKGGRPAFMIRVILAATLSSVYGIYSGYELCENEPVHKGSEEYLDSEKYQLKKRDWETQNNIKELIKNLNRIRKDNQALHWYGNLKFYKSNNSNILVYAKTNQTKTNSILVVVSLDPFNHQEGEVQVNAQDFSNNANNTFTVTDLLSGQNYTWSDGWNFVRLEPASEPAHIFLVGSVLS
jgi:starch synthase (maltosyl-transferring)